MTTTRHKKNIKKRPGYKHTPLGWIPEDWEMQKIIDKANVKGRVGWKGYTKDDLRKSGPLVLGASHINNNKLDLSNPTYLSQEKYEESPEIMINKGDLIFVQRGSLGGVAIINQEIGQATINPSMVLLKPKTSKNVFLFYLLSSVIIQKQLYVESSQTGVPMVSQKQIGDFVICWPSSEVEVDKITAILSTWDDAIQQTQTLIKQLAQRNKGLAQQLLKPKKEWEEVKMSTLFERITDKNEEGNDNVVTISAQRGFVKQETFFKKRVASNTLHNYFLVEKGDFCYNKSYSTGYDWGAIKRLKDFDKAVVTTLYICFRITDERKISGAFFEHFFEAGKLDKGLSQIAHEGGRAHGLLNVTPKDFFNLKFYIPNTKEQQAIAAVLDKAQEELKQQEQYLAALQKQKKGLMQQLLTGAVRVKIDNV